MVEATAEPDSGRRSRATSRASYQPGISLLAISPPSGQKALSDSTKQPRSQRVCHRPFQALCEFMLNTLSGTSHAGRIASTSAKKDSKSEIAHYAVHHLRTCPRNVDAESSGLRRNPQYIMDEVYCLSPLPINPFPSASTSTFQRPIDLFSVRLIKSLIDWIQTRLSSGFIHQSSL
jgi:hypothetical protein